MNSKLLYLRIPAAMWDAIAARAERTGTSFAKAGIAVMEKGLEADPETPEPVSPLFPTPAP